MITAHFLPMSSFNTIPDPYQAARYMVTVKGSAIEGRGLFAGATIQARRKLGEMHGEVVSEREGRRRAKERQHIAIVETGDGRAVDASQGNVFRFINHSCAPNTFIRIFRGHVEFYALRDIGPGEELTCDYGESHHDGKLPCRCRSHSCRGFI